MDQAPRAAKDAAVLKKWLGRVVTAEEVIDSASVVAHGDQIVWVGRAKDLPEKYAHAVEQVPSGPVEPTIIPGLVDVHCHGGGGVSFPDSLTLDDVRTAAGEHLKHGTTTIIASLVTAPVEILETRARLLAVASQEGIIAGIHYEGPFLSEIRCGAQDPRYLIRATPDTARRLVDAAGGMAVSMTIAPEMSEDAEGRESLKILVAGGILPSWGHTDCGIEQANDAVDTGVGDLQAAAVKSGSPVRGGRATATHLFNGMRPLHHRNPGPIPALLAAAQNGRVVVEMINDGIHLDSALVASVIDLVGRDNAVFVTDAMAATGMPDGSYALGSQAVHVKGGVARLADSDAIAGGTAHLLDCVRTAVKCSGIDLVDAVYLASAQGAAVLGLDDRGSLAVGLRADLVVADDDLRVMSVVRCGKSASSRGW